MEKESLYIYKLDIQGKKVKFPNSDLPAKLGEYTYSAQRMAGTPTLTANLNYPACLDDEWTGEEFVEFKGERYYVGQVPTSSKDNKSIMYKHELQFVSERIVLENVYFMDVVTSGADTYHSNSISVKFMGDVHEFVGRLNASMKKSGIGYSVVIDDDITSDSKLVSLDNVYLADALQSIYTIYELPYYFVGKVCHIGYTENVISTPFAYRKGLVSIKKTNANYKIVNRVTGVGSSDNIPFYYPNDDEKGTIERSQNLMPSIYRESGGAERFYNALNNKYKIPGTNNYYSFKNTYSAKKVKEIKVDFSDIKPTIEGVTNASGQLFGEIADIAFDENDSDELGTGEGNNVFNGTDEYVHSYFYIKLHIYNGDYGFNLFEQGLEGGTAVINMTTGNCAACEFEIGVTYKDGDKRAYNPVLLGPTGNLIPGDFEQKVTSNTSQYVASQQDTSKNEVWIAVKKDNTSFGVVMPNATNNYRPSVGDKFVITGIKMPKPLVLAAEKRLEEALIKYMSENNDEKFSFSLSFSRVFLADNSHLADILNENARIYIKYNNREYLMYVNSFTCKADKNCLYDISVELTDKLSANVSALRSTITEIAGSIIGDNIGSGGNVSTSDILSKVSRHFLSKRHDDRTPYKVSSDTAFEIGKFVSGASGGLFSNDKETGQSNIEVDKLYVRMKAYFESLEIVNVNSIGGKQIISPAGSVRLTMAYKPGDKYKIVTKNADGKEAETEVTVPQGVYRCFFLAEQDGQEVENRYKAGDQVQSKDFNIKKPGIYNQVANHYYWRLVTGVTVEPVVIGKLGYHYVDLSITDCDTRSDVPAEGDVIAHLGNRNDVDRQNAIVFSSVDVFSPSITLYQGINSYSYLNKDVVSYGVDKTTGKAFFNVYGDMYIGDRNMNSFLKFTQQYGLEIKGKLDVNSTLSTGGTLTDALKKATEDAVNVAKEDIGKFNDAIQKDISNLQDQVDGAIETWFSEPVPTLTNYPANEWSTNELKNIHLGDLYYSGDGKAYRFQMDGNNYIWKEITDSDVTKALADAKKAQDTADGKRKVFVKQPTDNDEYDVGDLWVNATYGTTYSNDILRAVNSKAKGSPFSINHWTKSSKYTDDTRAEQVQQNVDNLSTNINNVSNTVNSMKDFTDTAFADGIVDRSEASAITNYLKVIETTQEDVANAYSSVYNNALLDGVSKVNLNSGYNAFNTSATELIEAVNSAIADGKTTSIERANVDAKYTNFNTKYGDFVAYINAANKYIQDKINKNANDALTQIGGLAYLKKALKENTSIEGGLIQSSMLALGYTPDNGAFTVMSGTNGIYDSSKRGGGIASWWGGGMIDKEDYTPSNVPANAAKGLVRFDGSGYLANGNVKWDVNGKITADPLSFFVGESTVGALLASFQIVMQQDGTHPDYIIPKVPFQSLDISTSLRIGDGYLKWDSQNKALYVEGKNGDVIGFYSKGWLSSLGVSSGGGGVVVGASALSELEDVLISSPSNNQVLSYDSSSGKWVNKSITGGLDATAMWNELKKVDTSKVIDASHIPTSVLDGRWVKKSGDTMTGLLVAKTGSSHTGFKLGNAYLTEVGENVVFQNLTGGLRFGKTDIWDFDRWAGIKYDDTNKTIYLGIADGTIFRRNTAPQTGGTLRLVNSRLVIDLTGENITTAASLTHLFTAVYKAQGQTYTSPIISIIGTNQTGNAFNSDIRIGSTSGATWISAGESGAALQTKVKMHDGEKLYLSTDDDIRFYTNAANDASSYSFSAYIDGLGVHSNRQLFSHVAQGTAPLVVNSSTNVTNLNADYLDGYHQQSFLRTDGTNQHVTLTGGNGNTKGYRLVLDTAVTGGWSINSMTLLVNSRHSGTGIISLVFHTTNEASTTYFGSLNYYGSSHGLGNTMWRLFYDTTSKRIRLFWHYYDYNDCRVSILNYRGLTASISNGTWYTTLPSGIGSELPSYYNQTIAADKLATARTLWGQSFNGTANVSGSMTGVGAIAFNRGDGNRGLFIDATNGTYNIIAPSSNNYAMGLLVSNNDNSNSLGFVAGAYGPSNAITYYFYGGNYSNPLMVILPNGSVGIGNKSPNERLCVSGNANISGRYISKVATGTKPIDVVSTTLCNNLNADMLDGHHENAFLRHRVSVNTDGEGTLWSQIGIKNYHGAYPDGVTLKIYNYGAVISFASENSRLDVYTNHWSSDSSKITNGIQYRSGWGTDKKPWRMLLDNVNYSSYVDSRYVKKTGDSMTGSLTIGDNGGNSRLQLNSTSTDRWSYLRLNHSGNYWDIASKSNDHTGLEFRYNGADTIRWVIGTNGSLTSFGKGEIYLNQNSDTSTQFIRLQGGANDYGRIAFGATAANAGWMEIASADDGTEPIYARQYTGVFTTIKNTLVLLDANGDTIVSNGKGLQIGSGTRRVGNSGNWIHGGADTASSTDANLRFGSWFGIGWYPTSSNNAVAKGNNAMWLNVRNGYLYTAGAVQTLKFISTVATGTAPYQCNSTTVNTNLNADLLDGFHTAGQSTNSIIKYGNSVGGTTAAWSRIAKYSILNTETMCDVCFILHSSFSNRFALLNIRTRGTSLVEGQLISSYNINPSKIRIYHSSDKKEIELYYYGGEGYSIINAQLLYSTNRDGAFNSNVTMYRSNTTAPSWSTYVGVSTVTLQNNAASATKLATSRNIWGKPFNGTADITGDMTNVTSINGTSDRFRIGRNISDGGNLPWYGISFVATSSEPVTMSGYLGLKLRTRLGILRILDNGNIGIGTDSPSQNLHIVGNAIATGAITAKSSSSDIRLKTDIQCYGAMDIVRKFRSVRYHWNDIAKKNSEVFNHNGWNYGLIAQELLSGGFNQWVKNVFNDYYTIDYERLIPVVWKGLQEVDDEVTVLKRRVRDLETEVKRLKSA